MKSLCDNSLQTGILKLVITESGSLMSFLKNAYLALTDKWELKEPKLYFASKDTPSLLVELAQLASLNDPSIDQKKVEEHRKLFTIGDAGEKSVLFELEHSLLPLVILHDVPIEYKGLKAQLDFVILTRKFILVLEVKKLFGNIHITEKGEFQRIIMRNNRVVSKEGMYSPINQVERHVAILEKLLKETDMIQSVPIYHAVTFANPKTIIDIAKKAPKEIQQNVIRHDQIKQYFKAKLTLNSPVNLPDQKIYMIADRILQYRKPHGFDSTIYRLQDAEPKHQEPVHMKSREDQKASLIAFRLHYSRQTNRKAYHIFTNQTLDSLLEMQPRDTAQLLEIPGLGPKKVEEFGKTLLDLLHGKETFYENQ